MCSQRENVLLEKESDNVGCIKATGGVPKEGKECVNKVNPDSRGSQENAGTKGAQKGSVGSTTGTKLTKSAKQYFSCPPKRIATIVSRS